MKTLMRTLTLSVAALATLVTAPKSEAQEYRGGAYETFHGGPGYGHEFRAYGWHGGYGSHNRGYVRRPAYSYGHGRRYVSPFRVYAGSRFYSYRPGPGYIYVAGLGWVFPPFPGARWFPAHLDRFGVQFGGRWR